MTIQQKIGRWLPLLLWMGLIFVVSGRAKSEIPDYGTWDLFVKKAAHFSAYGVLALLALWALRPEDWKVDWGIRPFIFAFLIAVLYAISDEFHQTFVPGRNGTLLDIGIDTLGAFTALLLCFLIYGFWFREQKLRGPLWRRLSQRSTSG